VLLHYLAKRETRKLHFSLAVLVHCQNYTRRWLIIGSIARSASRRYLKFTQRPILRFFAPQGRHVAPMGVKIWHGDKFHPLRCNDKGVGPQKLKFLLRFDQNVEYKRPDGAYPLRDFHKVCSVRIAF